jgi:hypothetical protein
MEKLAELLDERQKQLQDHEAGHRKLSSEVCWKRKMQSPRRTPQFEKESGLKLAHTFIGTINFDCPHYPQDHARVTRQATNFERKLTQLKSMDATELADMMQHEAESLYRLNSVDYLDFELKN